MLRKSYWNGKAVQDKVLGFIDDYWRAYFRSPSYREIMAGIDAKSISCISIVIKELEKSNRIITISRGQGRSFRQSIPLWVAKAIDSAEMNA